VHCKLFCCCCSCWAALTHVPCLLSAGHAWHGYGGNGCYGWHGQHGWHGRRHGDGAWSHGRPRRPSRANGRRHGPRQQVLQDQNVPQVSAVLVVASRQSFNLSVRLQCIEVRSRLMCTLLDRRFEQGSCPYGPTCKYAHGPGDLRTAGGAGQSGPRPTGAGRVMTPNGPPAGMGGPGMGGDGMMMGGGMQPRPPAPSGGGGGGGDKSGHWRTRLCEQFMQHQTCRYGDKCTFAHG